jgi:hypothetical protein
MQVLNPSVLSAVQSLWENDIPSKVGVFGWRLLLEKLPTFTFVYVFCFNEVEDCPHLFFKCQFMKQVWSRIFRCGWDVLLITLMRGGNTSIFLETL